jgi:glutathione synthase/RimK-type ligase-like ATP-grasp enzyme
MSILIIADPWDSHAYPVMWALQQLGKKAALWYSHDFPQHQSCSLKIPKNDSLPAFEFSVPNPLGGPPTSFSDVDTIWLRRWYKPAADETLHPADKQFAQNESGEFLQSALYTLSETPRFWVNPLAPKVRADRKTVQLVYAKRYGLRIPDTLVSNHPEDIRRFFAEHGGRIVYKSITPVSWVRREEDKCMGTYTTALTAELLADDDALNGAPGIYQEQLEKDYELRVTIIGNNVFAAKIDSQKSGFYPTDWRANQFSSAMTVEAYDLPEPIRAQCTELMRALGLVFGAMDFVVTPKGEYIFLEVNEMGQFLWVEGLDASIPLLDCFARFLASGDPAFKYTPGDNRLRLSDYDRELKATEKTPGPTDGKSHRPVPIWFALQE